MTIDCHGVHHALRSRAASPFTSIWISDSFLAESIQRFTYTHRRHGSAVPGPLEARKRATRGRNTSIAFAGHGGSPIEVAAMFGPDNKVDWWNNPSLAVPQAQAVKCEALDPLMCFSYSQCTANPLLPSWLSERLPSLQQRTTLGDPSVHDKDFWKQKVPNTSITTDQFYDPLSRCQSLQEIRVLIRRLEINLVQTPDYSRKILKHLLDSSWTASSLRAFFLDATLHTPGSGCFEELLQSYVSQPHEEAHINGLHHCIRESLNLGIMSGQDVKVLLNKLPHVQIDRQGTITKLGETVAIQNWYLMMANAIRQCHIFTFQDLEEKQLQLWCQRVVEAPFGHHALGTFAAIQQYLKSHSFSVNTARGLINRWVIYEHRNHERHTRDLTARHHKYTFSSRMVSEFLTTLQPAVAVKSIYQTTEKLVRDVLKKCRQPNVLEIWMRALESLPELCSDGIPKHCAWKNGLSEDALEACGFSSKQGIIVRLWTATQLSGQKRGRDHAQHLRNLIQGLIQLFHQRLKPEEDAMMEFLFTLQSLPLPSPSSLLDKIAKAKTEQLHLRGSVDKLHADLSRIFESSVALFKDDDIYHRAEIYLTPFLRQMAERVNTDPAAFLQVAHQIITQDKASIKMIIRMLRHNRAFNIALSQSAPSRIETQPHQLLTTTSLTPAIAIYILNSLARSFALSPAMTPRQSYRKVHWVYLILHRYTCGTAIGPDLTRALWHAGVTRYKDTGTSPTKIAWILSKVREVEGQQVADQLLWFGSGGVSGWEDWTKRWCNGVDSDGWRRVFGRKPAEPSEETKLDKESKVMMKRSKEVEEDEGRGKGNKAVVMWKAFHEVDERK
jgi:hypothetical protein